MSWAGSYNVWQAFPSNAAAPPAKERKTFDLPIGKLMAQRHLPHIKTINVPMGKLFRPNGNLNACWPGC